MARIIYWSGGQRLEYMQTCRGEYQAAKAIPGALLVVNKMTGAIESFSRTTEYTDRWAEEFLNSKEVTGAGRTRSAPTGAT